MFSEFVNASKENNFFAEVDAGIVMHAGMRTEVCKVVYKEGRVFILSKISSDNGESTTGEFNIDEEHQILGLACLGVLYFCDLYALATGQNAHFDSEHKKSDVSNNEKNKHPTNQEKMPCQRHQVQR